MEKSRELFVANIIRLRNRRNLTQAETAHSAGVSLRTYQKYEAGKVFPSSPTLSRLAETFRVPQAELFAESHTSDKPTLVGQITEVLFQMPENELSALLETLKSRSVTAELTQGSSRKNR